MPYKTSVAPLKAELPKVTMLHGRWDAGKTFMALTAAEDFPPPPYQPTQGDPEPHHLRKTGIIMWEKGTAGMQPGECNIHPAARLEMYETQPMELISAIAFVVQEMRRLEIELGINYWIHDSLTAFDVKNVVRWSTQVDGTGDNDTDIGAVSEDDNRGQGLYRAVLNTHVDYYNGVISVPNSRHTFICHSKAVEGGVRVSKRSPHYAKALASATMKAKAKGLDVNASSLAAAITGQAWDHYYRNCDIIGYLEKTERVKADARGMPQQVVERTVTLRQKNNVIARCRYAALNDVEPADFRVLNSKILAPTATAVAQPTIQGK